MILGKIDFDKAKGMLEGYKKALGSVDNAEIVNYMTHVSNEIKSFCANCLLSCKDEDTAWIRMPQTPF